MCIVYFDVLSYRSVTFKVSDFSVLIRICCEDRICDSNEMERLKAKKLSARVCILSVTTLATFIRPTVGLALTQ